MKKLDLIVIRINKLGTLSNSRPCYNCLKMMQDIGIKKIYYSSGIGNDLVCEQIKFMVSIQSSTVTRFLDCRINNKDKNEYYNDLLKKNFPRYIKRSNLKNFINYNFINIFPNYVIIIRDDIVIIMDNCKNILIQSTIFE
jgi:hypothetical protein